MFKTAPNFEQKFDEKIDESVPKLLFPDMPKLLAQSSHLIR